MNQSLSAKEIDAHDSRLKDICTSHTFRTKIELCHLVSMNWGIRNEERYSCRRFHRQCRLGMPGILDEQGVDKIVAVVLLAKDGQHVGATLFVVCCVQEIAKVVFCDPHVWILERYMKIVSTVSFWSWIIVQRQKAGDGVCTTHEVWIHFHLSHRNNVLLVVATCGTRMLKLA